MKVLLLGANGQVGSALRGALSTDAGLTAWDRSMADLSQPAHLSDQVLSLSPDVIVNAAAYTAVDRAESEPDRARRINSEAVAVLATCAATTGALLVHYSTDYVFDGLALEPYREDNEPSPLSVYGRTKLAGEEAIRSSGCRHLTFRTSWVFAAHGHNFLRTILRLATEREELQIVDDQIGAPTSARLIAEITRDSIGKIANEPLNGGGTYHLAPHGETSWCGYARFVVEEARRMGWELRTRTDHILPITTSDYPQPARRPQNSRLNTERIESWLRVTLPDWREGVLGTLTELTEERGRYR